MKTIALASVLAALAGTAGASEVFVTPDDDLGSLLFGAESGSVFVLGPGEYVVEATDLIAPNFTIRSTDGPEATVITLADEERLLFVGSEPGTLTFDGITLKGRNDESTLISYENDAIRLLATNCRFEGPGAGMFIADRSVVTFRDCTFDGFTRRSGVTLFDSAEGVFERCIFINSRGPDPSVTLTDSVDASFYRCLVANNLSDGSGGGIHYEGRDDGRGSLVVSESIFRSNSADGGAGILVTGQTTDVRVASSLFEANVLTSGRSGAAIAIFGDDVSVQSCVFAGNGGGLGTTEIEEDTVALFGDSVDFTNNVVVQNSEKNPEVAILIGGERSAVASHNTIVGPGAFDGGPQGSAISGRPTGVSNNIIRGFDEPFFDDILFTPGLEIEFNNIEGFGPQGTNIDEDPLFADVTTLDFRLLSGSPSIDAGSIEFTGPDSLDFDGDLNTFEPVPTDATGAPRAAVFDGQLTNPDQGAFEFAQTVATPCTPADLVEPFGVVDLSDVDAFVASFLVACP